MTSLCALSQSSLPAHHSPASAGVMPAGGFALASERLNSDGVIGRAPASPPFLRSKPTCRLFDDGAEREQRLLLERPADELETKRQALRVEAAWNGNARQTGHVDRDREHVVEVHLDRIGAALFADAECR